MLDHTSDGSEDGNSGLMSPSDACLLDADTYRKLFQANFDSDKESVNSSASDDGGGGAHFFEGAEKRLVIYLKKEPTEAGHELPNLRTISRDTWQEMLNLVNCRILNVISNDHQDAYLLSESSMFVSQDRVLIKTCGTTTLLHCIGRLLELVKEAGFDAIEDLFYSHKNLLVPSAQISPHHSFLRESEHLDKMFSGLSHLFGHVNSDRYYLYVLDNRFAPGHENEHWRFEIIMEQLDQRVMDLFIRPLNSKGVVNESISASEITRKSGIDKLIPGMVIDDFFFTPCGYSMNGLLGGYYMTIHITPEPGFSYVSLEMNLPKCRYSGFINQVLNTFKPDKFMFNLTAPDLSSVATKAENRLQDNIIPPQPDNCDPAQLANIHGLILYEDILGSKFAGFRRCDLQLAHYKQSDIIYARYVAKGEVTKF